MVSTFFFFAYGAGQIINGLFCKQYNVKWFVFCSLLIAALMNIFVIIVPNFEIVKLLWLVNGLALSVLWPCMIRLLSETLPRKAMARASVVMGTTVAVGTFVIYGLSALFAAFDLFQLSFITATVLLVLAAFVWLIKYSFCVHSVEEEEETPIPVSTETLQTPKKKMSGGLFVSVCFLSAFAVATNLIKDGLTTWVPSILNETYALPASFSILLTLALPLVAVFGNVFAVALHKKIPDFILLIGTLFFASGLLIVGVIGLLSTKIFVLTLVSFTLVNGLVSSSNSVITSIFPLYKKNELNSGLIAGVLNGFCYLGSTISSYGLGAIADTFGWTAVFYLLLGVCVAVAAIAIFYGLIKLSKRKNR